MDPVKVTPEDLSSASTQLSTGSQEIYSQLTMLRGTVHVLARSDWQGAELSTSGRLCQQWNTAAANLREALDGLSSMLANGAAGLRQP
jgi:WXG100 family type VII secretion target